MKRLIQDLVVVAFSLVIAVFLLQAGAFDWLLAATNGISFLGTFIAGIFFTSIFTVAPAVAALSVIAQTGDLLPIALIGGAGAVIGDLIIFRFVKDRFSKDLLIILGEHRFEQRLKALLKLSFLRWFLFLLGGLIIASPLPDELGVSLLGFAKMRTFWFIPLSFILNSVGIFAVGLAARSL